MNQRIAFYGTPYPHVHSAYAMIDCAAANGMKVLEAFTKEELETPDLEAARKIRAYADKRGVKICCLSCYTSISPENVGETVPLMKAFVDVAAILGSPYFHHTLVSKYDTPEYVIENKEALFETVINAVREIYDYGQSVGVRLVYEDQGYLINGVEGFGRFLDTVDRDVGVVLDFGNHYNVDEDMEGFFNAFKDRVCHVHVKDVIYADQPGCEDDWIQTLHGKFFRVVPMGQGIIDHEKYIKQLEAIGYTGCYGLEYGAPSQDSPLLDDTIMTLDRWIKD